MDVKLAFLTIVAAMLSYHTEVGRDAADSYTAVACQRFPVRQKELYYFVTFPDIADKWLDWISLFASADHKALGVGKMYKAIIKNFVMHFKVTEFTAGASLVMESNFLFRPRVELQFSELPAAVHHHHPHYPRPPRAHHSWTAAGPPNVSSDDDDGGCGGGNSSGNRNNGCISPAAAQTDECASSGNEAGGDDAGGGSSSKLIIKLYFQRNSLMFQYTLGTIFRSIFEYQLRESLQNLLAIVVESTTCPNVFLLN